MKISPLTALALAVAVAMPIAPVNAHASPEHELEAARVQAMQASTLAFLATLTDPQRETVVAALDNTAARTGWSNLPVALVPRRGLPVSDMTAPQRRALHAMLVTAFSSQGYLKTTTSMWHEDVLREKTARMLADMPDSDPRKAGFLGIMDSFDSEKFFVSVFGDPASPNWGWMITGHHYSANFTVADGKIAFVPMFLGADPQKVADGRYAGWNILQHEADRAFALIRSLQAAQLSQALIADAVDNEVFAGPGNRAGFARRVGIKASDLDPLQLRLLNRVIDEYLDNASDEASARQRAAIEKDGYGELHFAWWGPTDDPAARYMFRIHGPSILIDYVREASPDGGFNHVHSVLRDPTNDYGADWLKVHYEEAHQD